MNLQPYPVRFPLAALLGGLAAVAVLIVARDVDRPLLLCALVVAVAAFSVLATAVLAARSPAPVPTPPRPTPPPSTPPPPAAAGAVAPRPTYYAGAGAAPAQPWYDRPAATVAVPVRADSWPDHEPDQEPDRAEAAVTRVVQCPRCGDFAVDVRQHDQGFAFACTACDHRWHWRPGTSWPVSVVRPRRRPDPR
jgi:hypothetical protein